MDLLAVARAVRRQRGGVCRRRRSRAPCAARRRLVQRSGQRALGLPRLEQPGLPVRLHRFSCVVFVPHLPSPPWHGASGVERAGRVHRDACLLPALSADYGLRAEARRGRWRGPVPSARRGSAAASGAYQTGAPAGLAPPAPRPPLRGSACSLRSQPPNRRPISATLLPACAY